MKKLFALILALLLLTSCGTTDVREEPEESGYGLWFAVRRGSERGDSFSVAQESRAWGREPTAQQLMDALLSGPISHELYSPFPGGVAVRGITFDESKSTLQVDMTEPYGGLVGYDLTLADSCITMTLCQLPGVDTVEVLVAGEPIPYRNRQGLHREDILLTGVDEQPGNLLMPLYFPSHTGEKLAVEQRPVKRIDEDTAAVAMFELLAGPTDREKCSPLPAGTHLRSLEISDGLCQVDLSGEYLSGSKENAAVNLYALVNTLCALSEISQVRLLVEGERLESYGDISLRNPLTANYDLLR